MSKQSIGIFVGSLRKDSYSRAVANYFVANSSKDVDFKLVEIGQLPIYNQDLDGAPPAEWVVFREQIKPLDGVLFVTPEHNRSFPAALKNALDVGSRPYGANVWNGKPGGVVSVSPGALGGFGANHQLRQVLTFLNVPTMQQPEAYVGSIMAMLDKHGVVADESLKGFLKAFQKALIQWVALVNAGK
jgi:chromate reductase